MPTMPKEYMNKWMQQRRLERRREGLCIICGSHPARANKVSCEVCAARNKAYKTRLRDKRLEPPVLKAKNLS